MKKYALLVLTLVLGSTAFADLEQSCIDQAGSIEQKLGCISGLTVINTSAMGAKKVFDLRFEQPLDHTQPAQNKFKQRLVLIHRAENEPMVLQTSGYSIFGIREAAITTKFGTNQLQVEHRFFSDSKPTPVDWSKLDIKQSADDFHAITVAFQRIYQKPWINTGASKGGMTSVYHRRFYPNDLAGTVADVAPLSYSTADARYVTFIEEVGGEAYRGCRENLQKLQIQLLENREKLVPQITGNFQQLGSAEVAFEHAVIESSFYFWQYGNPDSAASGCSSVPVNATAEKAFSYLQTFASVSDYTDGSIARFLSYYFQAATQLGSPGASTAHIAHLLKNSLSIDQYTPKEAKYTYSNEAMSDVAQWVRTSAENILFVYGEFDPWSAGEFPVSETGKSIYKLYVPKGNHGSNFTQLQGADKTRSLEIISQWLGKQPLVEVNTFGKRESLEALEFEVRRRNRL